MNQKLKETWHERIQTQITSGLSAHKWCLENQVNYHTFKSWSKKFRKSSSSENKPEEASSESINWLEISDEVGSNACLTVKIEKEALSIEVSSGFDQSLLREVVMAVRNLC